MTIPLITRLVHYFNVFYGYAGKKLFILSTVILLGGISESIGLSMLLPLLSFNEVSETQNAYCRQIYSFLETMGIGVTLWSLLTLLFIAFLLKSIFIFIQEAFSAYITTNLVKTIRVMFCSKYEGMRYDFFTSSNTGYLNNVITIETKRAVGAFTKYIEVLINISFVLVYISASLFLEWRLTLFVIVICGVIFILLRGLSRATRRFSVLISERNAQIQSLLIQTLHNFKYLKATNNFYLLFKQLFHRMEQYRLYHFKIKIMAAIPKTVLEPTTIIIIAVLIWYNIVFRGKMMADILVLLIFFYRAFSRVFSFQTSWQKFNSSIGGIEVVQKATKELEQNQETSCNQKAVQFIKHIELKNVNFSFGNRKVLSNINILIPKNKSVGIVGESGAGKTTFFDLLTGLLEPQSGHIFWDGIDYRKLEKASLRSFFGYVTQEAVVFNDTISNNISFWQDCRIDSVRQKVESSAEMAHCTSFIQETNDGYDTILGDRGVKLSGGQVQRIAIAREIYKDTPIMILDEAVSALDTESEKNIQKSIKKMKGNRTLIIISHRLSTIKDCDYIYVFSKGKIVEKGSFDELYQNKNGVFYDMCQMQHFGASGVHNSTKPV